MANLAVMKKYLGYRFDGGAYTTPEYKSFETKYINYLKKICELNGWELTKANKSHFEFSAFIKNSDNKYVYFSISDVRYWQDGWYKSILIRTAKNDKDYTGGANHYTDLENLSNSIKTLLK